MELTINIDMNKIDYDAINKEILRKISEMDISKTYTIDKRVEKCVIDAVNSDAKEYIDTVYRYNYNPNDGSNLTNEAKSKINSMAHKMISEQLQSIIDKFFENISQEEFNKIILELAPSILVNLISEHLNQVALNYYNNASIKAEQIADNRIREAFRRQI